MDVPDERVIDSALLRGMTQHPLSRLQLLRTAALGAATVGSTAPASGPG
jgi:hypothetical protein